MYCQQFILKLNRMCANGLKKLEINLEKEDNPDVIKQILSEYSPSLESLTLTDITIHQAQAISEVSHQSLKEFTIKFIFDDA